LDSSDYPENGLINQSVHVAVCQRCGTFYPEWVLSVLRNCPDCKIKKAIEEALGSRGAAS